MNKRRRQRDPLAFLPPAILTGSLVPFVWLAYRAGVGELGANPISRAIDELGQLALILLVATLACTPLRVLFGFSWAMRLRRTLGVMSFVAATCHFLVYIVLDRGLDVTHLSEDLTKRPFILIGFVAFVLLIPLAATSTPGAVRALGGKRWRRLHRLAYLAAVLGVIHFFYRVKADIREPLVYAGALGTLLMVRVADALRRRVRTRRA